MKKIKLFAGIILIISVCCAAFVNASATAGMAAVQSNASSGTGQFRSYLSDSDAVTFLSFIYNKRFSRSQLDNDDYYRLLTGRLEANEDRDVIITALLTQIQAQLDKNITKAEYNNRFLMNDIQKYLEKKEAGLKDIPEQEYNSYRNKMLDNVKEFVLDKLCGATAKLAGIYVTEDVLSNLELVSGLYSSVIGAPAKAKKYADEVVHCVEAALLPINQELAGRYSYFSVYLSNLKDNPDKEVLDTIMAYNKLAIVQNYPLGTIDWYPGGNDSWIEHIDDIEKYAYAVYEMENVLSETASASAEWSVTFVSGCSEIPNVTYTSSDADAICDLIQNGITRQGYIFKGWYTDLSYSTPIYYDADMFEGSGNHTYYAKWQKKYYRINYNSNCSDVSDYSYIYDVTKDNWQSNYKMKRGGYIFIGWYWDSACTNKVNGTFNIYDGMTFYAKWEKQYEYTVKNGEAILTSFLGFEETNGVIKTDIELPSSIDGYPVTGVAERCIDGRGITALTIPNPIKRIEKYNFTDCTSLKSITVSPSLNYIDYYCFSRKGKVSVYITDFEAWCKATNLSVPQYGGDLYINGELLESLVVSTELNRAVMGCSSLKKVVVKGGVNTINNEFSGCKNLETIIIDNGVRNIGSRAFANCESIKEIILSDSVETIGEDCFYFCTALERVVLPSGIERLEDGCFWSCDKLSDIIIPDSVKYIGSNAFIGCDNLKSINVPKNVETIGDFAFGNCKTLSNITVSDGNAFFASRDGVLYNKNLTKIICYPNGKTDRRFIIPDTVTTIGNLSFLNNTYVEELHFPESVNYQEGMMPFAGCTSLKGIYITSLESWVGIEYEDPNPDANPLYTAKNLYLNGNLIPENLVIPDGVENIKSNCFAGCINIRTVTIPKSVRFIGYNAFYENENLKEVHISDLSEWCKIRFESNPLSCAGNLYLNGELVTELKIPDDVDVIPYSAFRECNSIKKVIINQSTEIKGEAFIACRNLTELELGKGVSKIDSSAFYGCFNLKQISFTKSVKDLSKYPFWDCDKLTDVYFYGSAEDYAAIKSPTSTKIFKNAAVHYVPFTETTVTYKDDMYTLNIQPYNLNDNAKIIIAGYNDNSLVETEVADVPNLSAFTFRGKFNAFKVMVWNSLDDLCPLAKAESVEKIAFIIK